MTASNVLDKFVESLKSQISSRNKAPKPVSWIWGLLLFAVTAIATGLLYWRLHKKGKELAKLKHEKDVAKQEVERAIVKNEISKHETTIKVAKESVLRKLEKVTVLQRKIAIAEDNIRKVRNNVQALKNWDDIDSYLSNR